MEQYNDSSDAPDVRTRRYRGSSGSPSAVQAGDFLFRSNHEYYNGTSLLVGGAFAFDNTNNANRTQFSVAVDTDGTGANPTGNYGQFKIDGNDGGAITFNNAYKFPTSDGTNGQALVTNGSGVLSFGDLTSLLPSGVISGSDQVTSSLDSRYVNVTGTESIGGNKTFSDNVIVTGNLTVNGTTTTVNSNTVNIGDNVLVLNSDETGTPSQNGGLEIERGTSTNSALLWDESNDYWVAGLAGAEERIVVGAGNTSITTVGTIGTGTWEGTAIADSYISSATTWNAKLDSAGTIATDDYAKYDANGDLVGRSYSEVKTDLSLSNVENIALSTYTGNGGALDNQYITNGAGYITSFDITTQTDSKYLRSDENDTASGVITFSNTTNSTSKTTGAVKISGGVGIAKTLNVGEDVVAYASSDRRLKDEITPISNPIEKISQIGGYSFVWNSEKQNIYKGKDYGVIAQEIEEILPELVDTRENGYKAVKYDKLVSLLIEGIKELSSEVRELKEKINRE